MIGSSRRFGMTSLGLALGLVLAVGFVGGHPVVAQAPAAQAPAPPAAAVPAPGQTTDSFFKNVQVLKGLPAELMQPSMQLMEISLGVHCAYCHDNDGTKRELDTKPQKAIARRMITMTQDINRTMFNGAGRVTCFTCHQGHTKPGQVVPYNDEQTREETTMPIAAVMALNTGVTVPAADALINNAVTAIGGAEALARANGRVLKGVVRNLAHLDEVHTERAVTSVTPFDVYAKGTNRMTVQHNINGDALTTYAGAGSWTKAGNADALGMRADQREAARMEEAAVNPADFKAFLTGLRVVGQEKVGDHTAWIVEGKGQVLTDVKLYFDRDSGLLLSAAWQQPSYFCCHQFRIDYDNYRIVGGVRVPTKWTNNGPRETILVYEMDTVAVDNSLEDSRFARPASRTAQR
jgi:cytochrome c553